MMDESENFTLNKETVVLLEEALATERLYKIYLLSPLVEKYYQVNNPGSVTFLQGFLAYFNQMLSQQDIFFEEDEPRKYHDFAPHDMVMFVLLVPPDLIVCVNGHLLLKPNEVIMECLVGVYLFSNSDQFFVNTDFSAPKIEAWLNQRADDVEELTLPV